MVQTGRNVLQVDGKCPALSQARALFAGCSSAHNLSQRLPINRVLFGCASKCLTTAGASKYSYLVSLLSQLSETTQRTTTASCRLTAKLRRRDSSNPTVSRRNPQSRLYVSTASFGRCPVHSPGTGSAVACFQKPATPLNKLQPYWPLNCQ